MHSWRQVYDNNATCLKRKSIRDVKGTALRKPKLAANQIWPYEPLCPGAACGEAKLPDNTTAASLRSNTGRHRCRPAWLVRACYENRGDLAQVPNSMTITGTCLLPGLSRIPGPNYSSYVAGCCCPLGAFVSCYLSFFG